MTLDSPVQDKTITLNGLRFHYREWGNIGAQPMLVLHGFSTHARAWDTFAKGMQDRFRVLVLDQRGHGETEWATDYAWERWIEDIDAFVQTLDLQRVVLLGHSMGGAHAYRYAGLHPKAVVRLILVDEGPGAEFTPEFQQKLAKFLPSDIFDDPEEAVRARELLFPRADVSALRHLVVNNMIQRDDGRWTYRYDARLRGPNAPRRHPDDEISWTLLSKVTCPTLIVRAAVSEYLSREQAEQMRQVLAQGQVVEIPNSGHAVPSENPSGLIAAVRTFLLESSPS